MEGELARFADLLEANLPRARQSLKKLLVDGVEFAPVKGDSGRPTCAFRGQLSYGAVLQNTCMASPTGFEPVFRP